MNQPSDLPERDAIRLSRLLPPGAIEDGPHLLGPDTDCTRSSFTLDGEAIAEVWWEALGVPYRARTAAWEVEYCFDGIPCYAAPLVDGKIHGPTVQWGSEGEILSVCRFEGGTGVDYWCDSHSGGLSEESPSVDGLLHGPQRHWNDDGATVHLEFPFIANRPHGIWRRWTDEHLDPGFPQFWIRWEEVDREAYLAANAKDATLPPYRAKDDDPRRPFPTGFQRRITRSDPDGG